MEVAQPNRLLAYEDVADRLGVDRRTLERLVAAGRLPACRLGRLIRFRESDLDAFICALPSREKSPAPSGPGRRAAANVGGVQ